MAIALRRLRDRIRIRLRDTDARKQTYNIVELDTAICDTYLSLQGRLPAAELYSASALTISASADTFTLPSTVTQWTGNSAKGEYAGKFRIQLASTGQFLFKLSEDEMASYRFGQIVPPPSPPGIPAYYTLYEGKDQLVNGRCWPTARVAEACHLFVSMQADDLRDFIGAGTDDLDDVDVQFSKVAANALVLATAADLAERMTADDLALRRLNPSAAGQWRRESEVSLYREAARRHDIEDTGRVERRVS